MVVMTDPYEEISRHFMHHDLTHDFIFPSISIFQLKKHQVSLGICHNSEFRGWKISHKSTSSESGNLKQRYEHPASIYYLMSFLYAVKALYKLYCNCVIKGNLQEHIIELYSSEANEKKLFFPTVGISYRTSYFIIFKKMYHHLSTPSGQNVNCKSRIPPFKRITFKITAGNLLPFLKKIMLFLTVTFLHGAVQVH